MAATSGAGNFGAHSVKIGSPFDGTWNFLVETGPSTVGFEFVFGVVQWCVAAFADVGSFFPEGVEFACEGCFGAFVDYDAFFVFG
jgi:hypothetical protein